MQPSTQSDTLETIKAKALPILRQANIRQAALFGSYVRGDDTAESDIDILVAFPAHATLLDVVHLKRLLENRLNKDVDLVSYSVISPLIRESILKHQYQLV